MKVTKKNLIWSNAKLYILEQFIGEITLDWP
jgi:hypothetical protein